MPTEQAATAQDYSRAFLKRFSRQKLASKEFSFRNSLVWAWPFCLRKRFRKRAAQSKRLRRRSGCGFWVGGECRQIPGVSGVGRSKRCRKSGSFLSRRFIHRTRMHDLSRASR